MVKMLTEKILNDLNVEVKPLKNNENIDFNYVGWSSFDDVLDENGHVDTWELNRILLDDYEPQTLVEAFDLQEIVDRHLDCLYNFKLDEITDFYDIKTIIHNFVIGIILKYHDLEDIRNRLNR